MVEAVQGKVLWWAPCHGVAEVELCQVTVHAKRVNRCADVDRLSEIVVYAANVQR